MGVYLLAPRTQVEHSRESGAEGSGEGAEEEEAERLIGQGGDGFCLTVKVEDEGERRRPRRHGAPDGCGNPGNSRI